MEQVIWEAVREDENAPAGGAAADRGTLGLLELFLKDRSLVDSLIRDPARGPELLPRLLAIALCGLTVFGVAAAVLLDLAGATPGFVPAVKWTDGSAFSLILAYDLGMIAACGICLPSFYFFGLLAGVRATMLQVVLHALKGLASTAVVLVGIVPIYVAGALGLVVFGAPHGVIEYALRAGLGLPFAAGLWGVWQIHRGFLGLADTLPVGRRYERECFLRRLIAAWAAVYTAVTPVMIYTLWHQFG